MTPSTPQAPRHVAIDMPFALALLMAALINAAALGMVLSAPDPGLATLALDALPAAPIDALPEPTVVVYEPPPPPKEEEPPPETGAIQGDDAISKQARPDGDNEPAGSEAPPPPPKPVEPPPPKKVVKAPPPPKPKPRPKKVVKAPPPKPEPRPKKVVKAPTPEPAPPPPAPPEPAPPEPTPVDPPPAAVVTAPPTHHFEDSDFTDSESVPTNALPSNAYASKGSPTGQGAGGGGQGTGPVAGKGSGRGAQGHASGGDDVDRKGLLKAYMRTVNKTMRGARSYPRMAKRARLQGTVVVEITVDATGRIVNARIAKSSSHDILDNAALRDVKALGKLPAPPKALNWTTRKFRVPFRYRLR